MWRCSLSHNCLMSGRLFDQFCSTITLHVESMSRQCGVSGRVDPWTGDGWKRKQRRTTDYCFFLVHRIARGDTPPHRQRRSEVRTTWQSPTITGGPAERRLVVKADGSSKQKRRKNTSARALLLEAFSGILGDTSGRKRSWTHEPKWPPTESTTNRCGLRRMDSSEAPAGGSGPDDVAERGPRGAGRGTAAGSIRRHLSHFTMLPEQRSDSAETECDRTPDRWRYRQKL